MSGFVMGIGCPLTMGLSDFVRETGFRGCPLTETADDSGDTNLQEAFKRASKDDTIKKDLLIFVSLLLSEG